MPPIVRGVILLAASTVATHAESPAAYCKRIGTDDTTRPIPEALATAANNAFGMQMPARMVAQTTVFRCAGGRVMACTVGANLPCGKANTSQQAGAGAVQWCRDNPDATSIPAVATGHDTIFEWTCQSGTPKPARRTLHVDPRGFVAEFWKALP